MSGRKKFNKKDRGSVARYIRAYLADNPKAKAKDVANKLDAAGVKHPNGTWTEQRAANFIHTHLGGRRKIRRGLEKNGAPAKTNSDRLALAELVLSANLLTDEKERILKGLFA